MIVVTHRTFLARLCTSETPMVQLGVVRTYNNMQSLYIDGHDMHIADNSNANTNSYSSFGYSYVLAGVSAGTNYANTFMAGAVGFKNSEIEIWGMSLYSEILSASQHATVLNWIGYSTKNWVLCYSNQVHGTNSMTGFHYKVQKE